MNTPSQKTTVYIRLPSDMLATLRQMAEADDRSLNQIIVRLLRQAVEADKG